ncbi:aldose epimerase [Cellulomonas shaoxiangyii]|uniref:Aldose epimerase n=1 Tax=Cellulomonas shaoxiangyii TaxID=2566013 RepID=A0A4P7SKY5_9CELL|nr:aldose epimerase [Cellulomonas shaoxiangyii]QCB94870.1 aldose epimerase [Cellulomonas shaoxiangyii]TGY85099.1 aldose epimerase [Cellulomonas shaoxiangyii]
MTLIETIDALDAPPLRPPLRAGSGVPHPLAPPDRRVLSVRSDGWQLDVLPGTGACLAAGRIRTSDGVWRDLLRPTRRVHLGDPEKTASFPMVPWSNRIRGGVLPFRGRTWQLQRNAADGTAIHGAARHAAWDVVARTDGAVTLRLDSSPLVGVNFPWRFLASVTYAVHASTLTVTTTVRNVDDEPFPAGFGHHPYLRRALLPAGAPAAEYPLTPGPVVHVPASGGYRLSSAMATGPAGAPPARADYRTPRPLGTAFVDDVLTGFEPGAPVRLHYVEDGVTVEVAMDEAYQHLVLYAPRRRCYFAVEPATNVNDGFTLREAGVPGTGVFELAPGEERTGTFTITTRG